MQPFPTIKQVKSILPVSPQSQHETTNASGESYSLPVYMGGEPTPVLQTIGLCDRNMNYRVCAIVGVHSWEPKYNQDGCTNQIIDGWNVTLIRRYSEFGKKLMEVKLGHSISLFGSDLLVVNVGGGAVPQCKNFVEVTALAESHREAPLRDEHKRQLLQRLDRRGHRLNARANLLREFPELESYRQDLYAEQRTQRHFESLGVTSLQHLEEVLSIEKEFDKAVERETINLAPLLQQAQLLRQENRQKIEEQQLAVQKQREIEAEQKIEARKALKLVQQAQELEEANRLQQEQKAKKEEEAKQKQQIVDIRATQYERPAGLLPYQTADTQIKALRYHAKQGVTSKIIREWAAYLRSQCEANLSTASSRTSPTTSSAGAATGAAVGGFLGLAGGPLVAIVFAGLGGVVGDIMEAVGKSSQSTAIPSHIRDKWMGMIQEIDEIVEMLPEDIGAER